MEELNATQHRTMEINNRMDTQFYKYIRKQVNLTLADQPKWFWDELAEFRAMRASMYRISRNPRFFELMLYFRAGEYMYSNRPSTRLQRVLITGKRL